MKRVREIHQKMEETFQFDGIYTCMHDDKDHCLCRKPKPGLILKAAEKHKVDPGASFMVGDRARDIDAGRAAGCTTLLIKKSYSGVTQADYVARIFPMRRIILKCVGGQR